MDRMSARSSMVHARGVRSSSAACCSRRGRSTYATQAPLRRGGVRGDGGSPRAVDVHVPEGSVALAVGPEPYDVSSAVGAAPDIFINPGQHCETADGEVARDRRCASACARGGTPSTRSPFSSPVPTNTTARSPPACSTTPDAGGGGAWPQIPSLPRAARRLSWPATMPGQRPCSIDWSTRSRDRDDRGRGTTSGRRRPSWWRAATIRSWARCCGSSTTKPSAIWDDRPSWRPHRGDVAGPTSLGGSPGRGRTRRSATSPTGGLDLAADLVTRPGTTVAEVAQVGYSSPFALTTAFKRRYGLSPHQHRVATSVAHRARRMTRRRSPTRLERPAGVSRVPTPTVRSWWWSPRPSWSSPARPSWSWRVRRSSWRGGGGRRRGRRALRLGQRLLEGGECRRVDRAGRRDAGALWNPISAAVSWSVQMPSTGPVQ